ncbi:basic proline-rich protein-like [Colius striatus]|uniref:basic proline-rich protein-like n=1 Tax=Colius striatus TaxID=57412 RepID=UPI002B1DD8E4|nr:basic proline-rich protein-like [Colius striatus]
MEGTNQPVTTSDPVATSSQVTGATGGATSPSGLVTVAQGGGNLLLATSGPVVPAELNLPVATNCSGASSGRFPVATAAPPPPPRPAPRPPPAPPVATTRPPVATNCSGAARGHPLAAAAPRGLVPAAPCARRGGAGANRGGGCREQLCPSPTATCRTATLSVLTAGGGRVQRALGRGCDVSGAPPVVVTFVSHGELVTLRDGPPGTPETPPGPPPGPALCPTCDSADGSCGRRPLAALRCPPPRRPLPGAGDEGRVRGCGSAGRCSGLVALDTAGGRRVTLRCCHPEQCREEPEPEPSGLSCWSSDGPEGSAGRSLRCGGGRQLCASAWISGPSDEPWLLRGCATPSWCETPLGVGGAAGGGAAAALLQQLLVQPAARRPPGAAPRPRRRPRAAPPHPPQPQPQPQPPPHPPHPPLSRGGGEGRGPRPPLPPPRAVCVGPPPPPPRPLPPIIYGQLIN